jgi:hypothetical protein
MGTGNEIEQLAASTRPVRQNESLRDELAKVAMTTMLSKCENPAPLVLKAIASDAYALADAMLAARGA